MYNEQTNAQLIVSFIILFSIYRFYILQRQRCIPGNSHSVSAKLRTRVHAVLVAFKKKKQECLNTFMQLSRHRVRAP